MEVILDNNYYAFSANPDHLATVTVNEGELDYSFRATGPFQRAGTIAVGESRDFNTPAVLLSFDKATFEIDYPAPPPTEQQDESVVPPERESTEGS